MYCPILYCTVLYCTVLFRYEYIALLDIDEVIMPLDHTNWADMMEDVVTASLKVHPHIIQDFKNWPWVYSLPVYNVYCILSWLFLMLKRVLSSFH